MPELPEVETIVRKLNTGLPVEAGYPSYPPLPGCTVVSVRADWPRQVYPSVPVLEERLPGCCIESVGRRGKYLVFRLQGSAQASQVARKQALYLLIHLKMSGRLDVLPVDWPVGKHDHVVFGLDNNHELRFNDARKFGRVYLVDDLNEVLGNLGPEPLDKAFTLETFRTCLAGRSGALKPLLLNQAFIAGVGNIYADEALWRAGLHPCRPVASLSPDETAALYAAVRAVLQDGIRHGGSAIDWVYPDGQYQAHLGVYGRTGQACGVCGARIERMRVGQRGTHVCPRCQVWADGKCSGREDGC